MGEDDEEEAVGCGVCAGHGIETGDMRALKNGLDVN